MCGVHARVSEYMDRGSGSSQHSATMYHFLASCGRLKCSCRGKYNTHIRVCCRSSITNSNAIGILINGANVHLSVCLPCSISIYTLFTQRKPKAFNFGNLNDSKYKTCQGFKTAFSDANNLRETCEFYQYNMKNDRLVFEDRLRSCGLLLASDICRIT